MQHGQVKLLSDRLLHHCNYVARLLGVVHISHIETLLAVVAHVVTELTLEVLIEVVQEYFPPTKVGFLAKLEDLIECMEVFIFPGFGVLRVRDDEVLQTLPILVGVVQDAMGLIPIPPCATTLLGIVLQTLWDGGMDDKANIFLVDAQAKGYGCDDDVHLIPHPSDLHLLSVFVLHLGMIEVAFDVILTQLSAHLFTLLARETVYDATLLHEVLLEEHKDVF